jgi:hypothetical protein
MKTGGWSPGNLEVVGRRMHGLQARDVTKPTSIAVRKINVTLDYERSPFRSAAINANSSNAD